MLPVTEMKNFGYEAHHWTLLIDNNAFKLYQYFNAANQFLPSLPSGTALGQGPFREVRLLVDGQLAGVAYPYATIFTGGIVPTAWR